MRIRSVLFVPGSRPDRFEKALAAGADRVVIDLEDAVAPDGKDEARATVLDALANAPRAFGVRINSPRTAWGCADIASIASAPVMPAFVMVPKSETGVDVEIVHEALGAGAPPLMPLIESPRGLLSAHDIAAAPGVAALIFGGADYAADVGVALEWEPLFHARSTIATAAAAAGVAAVDVPYLDVKDDDGLRADTKRVCALGFAGRLCIHPAQVAGVNAAFTPSGEAVAHAQRIIQALNDAGDAVVLVDGKLLDEPVVRAARRTLEAANGGA